MHHPSSRAAGRDTIPQQDQRLGEFHVLAGHPGPADGCQLCAAQLSRQRAAGRALRGHQRHARQRVDHIIEAGS